MRTRFFTYAIHTLYAVGTVLFLAPSSAYAAPSIEDLKREIAEKTDALKRVSEEIARDDAEIDRLAGEEQTLGNAIRSIDITRKKTDASIRATGYRIERSLLEIKELRGDIGVKKEEIGASRKALGKLLREMDESETRTFTEVALSSNTVSEALDEIAALQSVGDAIRNHTEELSALKGRLEKAEAKEVAAHTELVAHQRTLRDQNILAQNRKKEQEAILAYKTNTKKNFQKDLAEKKRLAEELARELLDVESRLRVAIDPASLPEKRSGILGAPLAKMFITQPFGDTDFSRSGAYNGKGHNGIDLRAPIGTPVFAAERGEVIGVGNTDVYPGCYSYGKWVLVRHENGLTTVYGHLDLTIVAQGARVARGEIVGYSGNSGYSTGPHLHLSVFASQGVSVRRLGDLRPASPCAEARIPLAPLNAYLNPSDYL